MVRRLAQNFGAKAVGNDEARIFRHDFGRRFGGNGEIKPVTMETISGHFASARKSAIRI